MSDLREMSLAELDEYLSELEEAKDVCEKHGLLRAAGDIGKAQVEARRHKRIKERA